MTNIIDLSSVCRQYSMLSKQIEIYEGSIEAINYAASVFPGSQTDKSDDFIMICYALLEAYKEVRDITGREINDQRKALRLCA
jgi:hypothetical protein